MEYIKRMYGASMFGDILNDMLSKELYDYLRDSKLNVLGQPLPVEDQPRYSFKIDDLENEYAIAYEVGFVPEFEILGLEQQQPHFRPFDHFQPRPIGRGRPRTCPQTDGQTQKR